MTGCPAMPAARVRGSYWCAVVRMLRSRPVAFFDLPYGLLFNAFFGSTRRGAMTNAGSMSSVPGIVPDLLPKLQRGKPRCACEVRGADGPVSCYVMAWRCGGSHSHVGL